MIKAVPKQGELNTIGLHSDLEALKSVLSYPHMLLILCAVGIWGANFVIMKNSVDVLPPLMITAMRFLFTLVPAVFFVPKPKVRWTNLLGYGLSIGVVQFGCLYIAVDGLITPGLASLVVQMQVLFTIAMSIYLNSERITAYQLSALILAALGLLIIGLHTDNQTSLMGVALTLVAALGWASGNMFSKRATGVNMLSYVVWSTLFSVPPLVCLSLYFEGLQTIAEHLSTLNWQTFIGILWQAWGSTIFCYGIWGWLLARYSAASVAPFALLIPVFGMGASAFLLGESLPLWKVGAAMLVIAAMLLNTFGARFRSALRNRGARLRELKDAN